jgi:glycosyltransferase involved in cell wall biosynthesis
MGSAISIIVGFKNRSLERVKHSLDSLKLQVFSSFELIFIDYGSDDLVLMETRRLIDSYDFTQYKYIDTKGWLWNRAHALNIGIKYAKNETILIFDIDLILEPTFLQKIATLNYSENYYTFSSFYLPEKYSYQNDLLKTAIHFNQNYVGLCAISKKEIFKINGFDEFYMVWGVEDDDFYKRLNLSGLTRIQINANSCRVFHQWHPSHAPTKPSLWYLSMVTHFFKNNVPNSSSVNWGLPITEDDRFFNKSLIANSTSNILSFWTDQNLLFFNSFLQEFYQLESGKVMDVEYFYQPEIKKNYIIYALNFRKKRNQIKYSFSKNEVIEFLNYFIGSNRKMIDDYYFNYFDNKLQLYLKKI